MTTFPFARKCPFDPSDEYQELMKRGVAQVPLGNTGRSTWVLTRHEDIRKLLTDPRVSASRKLAGFPFYFDPPPEYTTPRVASVARPRQYQCHGLRALLITL